MNNFRIYNKEGKLVGSVFARSEGEAKNKAVADKLVVGRLQIGRVEKMENNDPYEQSWADVYG